MHRQHNHQSQSPITNHHPHHNRILPLLKPIFLPLIKQIRLGTPQIHNLGTPLPILLHLCTLLTIIRIIDTDSAADDAASFEGSVVAFVAYVDEGVGADEWVAYYTFAVACWLVDSFDYWHVNVSLYKRGSIRVIDAFIQFNWCAVTYTFHRRDQWRLQAVFYTLRDQDDALPCSIVNILYTRMDWCMVVGIEYVWIVAW